ncbi:MAG TPA: tyrosine-type recombinase/integrase [Mycobacteriales bacterium]|nr:tyrosine-type recombinase/integrase [Mycobacteriales bacterium]
MSGHVYKRCSCPVLRDEQGRKIACPEAHGSWTYVADVPVDDGAPRRQVTKGGFKTKRDAEAALRAFLVDADRGLVALPSRMTLGEYLTGWLDAVEPSLAPTAATNYRMLVRCYVQPHLGERRLTGLRPDHFLSAYRALLAGGGRNGRPLSATTVRTVHRILSKALSDAVRDGVFTRNPAQRVPLPRRVRPELQVWTREQLAAFLPVAAEDRLQAAWLLALLCGLRRGELAGLRWTDLDLEQRLLRVSTQRTTDANWQVVVKEPKGTSRRTVDLGPMLVDALRHHRERAEVEASDVGSEYWASGRVFTREDGTPYHPDRLRELFQAVAKRAGVPVIRLHDARHSCATLALDAGLHPKVVQQLLGHSSWSVTMDLYSHRVERLQRSATAQLEAHLLQDAPEAS